MSAAAPRVGDGISLEEFVGIVQAVAGPGLMHNPEQTFKKLKGCTPVEVEICARQMAQMAAQFEGHQAAQEGVLVPKLKPASYLAPLLSARLEAEGDATSLTAGCAYLAIDDAKSLYVMQFSRVSTPLGGAGRFAHSDSFTSEWPSLNWPLLSNALRDASQPRLEINNGLDGPCFLSAEDSGALVAPRLLLPSYVRQLGSALRVEAKDDILVVPADAMRVHVAKSSDYMGCCMLGDTDMLRERDDIGSQVYVLALPEKATTLEEDLAALARGELPVKWSIYTERGKPNGAPVTVRSDGKLRFAVPRSAAEADSFTRDLQAGRMPSVVHLCIKDESGTMGTCVKCCAFGRLKRCGLCVTAWYCCRACQVADWPLHKRTHR